MTSRKGMKLILIGTAALLIASMTVTADETEEGIPEIVTTSFDKTTNDALTRTEDKGIDQDATVGERGDADPEYPPSNEEPLLILPGPGDDGSTENLVAPAPGADGDVFILDYTSSEATGEKTTSQSDNSILTFPPLAIGLFVAFIGLLLVVGKKIQ
jgi:hypothetical protein